MVPAEWPIAPTSDGGPATARPAGSTRLPAARADFFLDPRARLTEQERALMMAMYADLVAALVDEFTVLLADAEPANDEGDRVFDRLWAAGLLDIPEIVALLLRRAESERLAAAIRTAGQAAKPRFLQCLVSDEDPEISAAAMALILARGRRRDRFDGPRLAFDDLSAEAANLLVHAIAAALRSDLKGRFDLAQCDERLEAAARALLARHDEGNRLEARVFELVHSADRAGKLDEWLVRSALREGDIDFLVETLGRRCGIGLDSAWDHLSGASGSLALLLRMSGISRELAGELIGALADIVGSDPETEIGAFDGTADEEVESARAWLRLDPHYRVAVASLGSVDGKRAF